MDRKNWKEIISIKSNPIIRTLIVSDIFINAGFGLVSPIFAVFLTDYIEGGSLEVVGIASTIYLLTKSLGQLPAAEIIAKIRGERDDFWAMVVGSIVASAIPLLYLLAHSPAAIYIIQFIYGLSQAFVFPSWMGIFTRHIDRNKEGLEWGMYYTLIDLCGAGVAAVGGVIAATLGFAPLFLIVSLFSLIGSMWLIFMYKEMRKR